MLGMRLSFSLVLGVVGLLPVGMLNSSIIPKALAFSDRGKSALVEPIDSYVEETETGRRGVQTKKKRVELCYTVGSGDRVCVKRLVPDDYLDGLLKSRPTYIEYLPDSPRTQRLPGDDSGLRFLLVCNALLLLFFGFGVRNQTGLYRKYRDASGIRT